MFIIIIVECEYSVKTMQYLDNIVGAKSRGNNDRSISWKTVNNVHSKISFTFVFLNMFGGLHGQKS